MTAYAASHQVAALDASGVATELPSQLVEFPSLPLALEEDRAECFQVTISEQDGLPVVLYDPETAISPFRRYQLCAQWAGNAIYYIQALEQ